MTALHEYARLESGGVWREAAKAQRRDVVVSFGDASLVISNKNNTALAHWSLAAVERLNPGEAPALFAPDDQGTETLEIEDETMVAAIEKVRTLIARRRPQPGRLRIWLLYSSLAAVLALLIFWMPQALLRHTVSIVPPATRDDVGTALLTQITRISGQPCRTARGAEALGLLSARLLGPEGGEVLIVPDGVRASQHLPGGLILTNRALVEDYETPEVIAGYVLAEVVRRDAGDPMANLLRHAGLRATFKLLTTGSVPPEALADYAEHLLTAPPLPVPADALLAQFEDRKVPTTPYAYALDITGESTLSLIEADPMRGRVQPLLSDADWVSLQGICGE